MPVFIVTLLLYLLEPILIALPLLALIVIVGFFIMAPSRQAYGITDRAILVVNRIPFGKPQRIPLSPPGWRGTTRHKSGVWTVYVMTSMPLLNAFKAFRPDAIFSDVSIYLERPREGLSNQSNMATSGKQALYNIWDIDEVEALLSGWHKLN